MSDVVANPEELEELARMLAAFSLDTRENLQRLNARLHEMGQSTWQDSRYDEYREQFAAMHHQVSSALDTVEDEHVTYLRSLAARLRMYL
jgi:uncharacterized protein YukE